MTGSTQGTVVANGIKLAFRAVGQGPALLPIMGFRLSGHAWPSEFIGRLAQDFRVITFDNRGTGDSEKPLRGYTMANLAQDAIGLLDALGIERAHVLGYSMGGAIAQELSCCVPGRVSRLALCNTWSGASSSVLAPPDVYMAMMAMWLEIPGAQQYFWGVTYASDYLKGNREAVRAQWEREDEQRTPSWVTALQYQAMRKFEIHARLGAIRAPTLVMAGSDDRLVPPGNARIIARKIQNARLQMLPGLGHRAFWEAPVAMAATLRSFFLDEAAAEAA